MPTAMSAATAKSKSAVPVATASSRASWAGQLALGPLTVPVKAYPALVVPNSGPLHQIHASCGARISQRKVCPTHGEVASNEIAKAFEYGPNDHLVISEAELDSLVPLDDKTIHVEALLPADKFEPSLLSGRSLYLTPPHAAAFSAYAQAVVVLRNRNVWGIGRMILSDSRRAIALQSDGRRLLLYILHWPEHRRTSSGSDVDVTSVTSQEVRALEKALLPLYKSFAWEEYRDEGSANLTALITAKIAGRGQPLTKAKGVATKPTARVSRARSQRAA